MQNLLDSFLSNLPVPTVFEMAFGLIISLVLFLIDRGGKIRQEETLRRQDDALDIILEQVSKVNVFQTKTLSLAIESLSNELNTFRDDLTFIKSSIENKNDINTVKPELKDSSGVRVVKEEPTETLEVKPSINFNELLSKQVNSFVTQIKHDISALARTELQKENPKKLYKAKKSLEFDLKDLLNIQTMISEINSDQKDAKEAIHNTGQELQPQSTEQKTFKQEMDLVETERNQSNLKSTKTDESSIEEQFDKFESIPDIVKFAENIISKFENIDKIVVDSTKKSVSTKPKRMKISPTKKITQSDLDNQHEDSP